MTTQEFIKAVNDEFDIETLELMQDLINERVILLKSMQDTAKRTTVKGFRR
jgi:hypothetical protein